jgi:hypothetical protein
VGRDGEGMPSTIRLLVAGVVLATTGLAGLKLNLNLCPEGAMSETDEGIKD